MSKIEEIRARFESASPTEFLVHIRGDVAYLLGELAAKDAEIERLQNTHVKIQYRGEELTISRLCDLADRALEQVNRLRSELQHYKMSIIEYEGYHAKIKVSVEDGVIIGEVIDVIDSMIFEAESISEIEQKFHETIDDYLKVCAGIGKDPVSLSSIGGADLRRLERNDACDEPKIMIIDSANKKTCTACGTNKSVKYASRSGTLCNGCALRFLYGASQV